MSTTLTPSQLQEAIGQFLVNFSRAVSERHREGLDIHYDLVPGDHKNLCSALAILDEKQVSQYFVDLFYKADPNYILMFRDHLVMLLGKPATEIHEWAQFEKLLLSEGEKIFEPTKAHFDFAAALEASYHGFGC